MAYAARIEKDSAYGDSRLTTFVVTFPRIVLAELNTHRTFSRGAASSRAIPTERLLDAVATDPFVPDAWGSNQPGMQAGHWSPFEHQARAGRLRPGNLGRGWGQFRKQWPGEAGR